MMFPQVHRFVAVEGYDQRVNDVLLVCNKPTSDANSPITIFFGGDIQDFPENMTNTPNEKYFEYNLEAVALLLSQKYKDSLVLVIHPALTEQQSFSCFSNFVDSRDLGIPIHQSDYNTVKHMAALISSITERVTDPGISLDTSPLTIIGFSKGCVVLNQLLHEFYHYNAVDSILDSSTKSFIGNVKKMIWLDGGHSGHEDTWITSNPILKNFAKMGISVDVHITPYQIKDERRPWLRREEKIFSGQLQKFGAIVRRVVHFEEETPTLDNHFRILKDF